MKKVWILLIPVGVALMLLGGGLWFFCLQMGATGYQTSIGNLSISFGKYGIQLGSAQLLNMSGDDLESSRIPLEGELTGLDLDFSIADVTITQNGDAGYMEWKNVPKGMLHQEINNGVLQVKIESPNHFFNLGFFDSEQECSLVINLPPEAALSDTTIDAGIGNLRMEGFTAGQLTIEGDIGDTVLQSISASSMNLNGDTGNIIAENITCQGKTVLIAGVGDTSLSGTLEGDLQVKCGVGDMDISLNGDIMDYQFDITGGVGTVTINDEVNVSMSDYHSLNQDAPYKFEVSAGVGDVVIRIE